MKLPLKHFKIENQQSGIHDEWWKNVLGKSQNTPLATNNSLQIDEFFFINTKLCCVCLERTWIPVLVCTSNPRVTANFGRIDGTAKKEKKRKWHCTALTGFMFISTKWFIDSIGIFIAPSGSWLLSCMIQIPKHTFKSVCKIVEKNVDGNLERACYHHAKLNLIQIKKNCRRWGKKREIILWTVLLGRYYSLKKKQPANVNWLISLSLCHCTSF